MAASTSRQPNQIPLPPSPHKNEKADKKAPSRKGKGKENTSGVAQGPGGSNEMSWDNLESDCVWDWTSLTDSSASTVPPIFTKDGSYFFSLVGSSIKIYSVATGQVVSTLSAPPSPSKGVSSDTLTTAILNPHNAFQLITGSLDGRLIIWDFLDAALLQVIDIAQPIHHICAHDSLKDTVFVAASRPSKKPKTSHTDDNAVVLRVSLKCVENTTKSAEILPVGKTRFPTGLSFSPSGAWLIATAGHKVYVAMTSSLASGFTKYVSPERLTCLVYHPTEEYFATGDDKGNIRLWYCLNDNLAVHARGVEKKTQTTTLHWHAHAVSSLAFTSNGAYLLSGGEESVLVIWQLHTGKKEFVPRVGAPISTVSIFKGASGEEEYLLGLVDATYLFVSSGSLKITRSYSRIKLDPTAPHAFQSTSRPANPPLAVHTLTSTLILPSSHPSSLQIYSPSSSKLVSELEVSPSNRVSRRDEKPIEPSYVGQVVISPSGEWLASIDSRNGDDGFRDEIYLKIWEWDKTSSRWVLNTRVDRPHGLKKVTCLAFSPFRKDRSSIHLVTTGEDGNVKIWGMRTVKSKSGTTEEFWVTRSTFGYRSQIPHSASWAPDASLLAISFGSSVNIYDPNTNILRQTLTTPECKKSTSAYFIGKSGRFLVVVGGRDLVCWDLLAQSARWNYNALATIDRVIPHPQDDSFIVFNGDSITQESHQTRISVFRPSSCAPVSIHTVPFRLHGVSLYPFSRKHSSQLFVGITQEWSVLLFGDGAKLAKEEGSRAIGIASSSAAPRRTLFQDIFGKSAFTGPPILPVSADGTTDVWRGKGAAELFDCPAYLMPPLEHLFNPFIEDRLRPRPDDVNAPIALEDEDVDMEDEAAEPTLVGGQRARVVDQNEMDSFIDLFRKHSVNHVHTHGAQDHPCLVTKAKTNGRSVSLIASTPKQASIASFSDSLMNGTPPSISSPSTLIVNGKKRKKSSS
ncbi:WD repeat-containing protein 75 [Hypsizygus marmoreus]|uniref:WD repeat-containing protein 75 n=1 Tax=Hypsizygus marmoreus TaxID=39966 RepID=A0A369K307_HYPMA|nr:WD repeat-containing protein 75 [Hypsizygus marmoreus]